MRGWTRRSASRGGELRGRRARFYFLPVWQRVGVALEARFIWQNSERGRAILAFGKAITAFHLLQSVELPEFMFVPVFATRGGLVNELYGVSDLFALALVTGTVFMLAVKARATVLVVILTLLAGLVAPLAGAANLVVTTPADVVNGDTSGPEALIGDPGQDGISLREAMLATNGAPGPHTITFAPPLAGQSIVLTQGLPFVSQDHITLTGLTTSDGKPNITIDGSHVVTRGIIFVRASHFKLSGLRMVGASSGGVLLLIRAATTPYFGAAPQTVTDIRIDRSSFSNFGFGPNSGGGIELGTDPGSCPDGPGSPTDGSDRGGGVERGRDEPDGAQHDSVGERGRRPRWSDAGSGPVLDHVMAVFLLRGIHGAGYDPPTATGTFTDVPTTNVFAKWIEQLAQEGITAGCSTNTPQYCPDARLTRGQMAVFLVRAFGLPP